MKAAELTLPSPAVGRLRRLLSSRVCEQLAVILLANGLSLALMELFGYAVKAFPLFFTCAVCTFFVWLFSRRAWALPLAIGISAACWGLGWLFLHLPIGWLLADALAAVRLFSAEVSLPVCVAFGAASSVLFFAFARLFAPRGGWFTVLLGMVCAAMIIVVWVLRLEHRAGILALLTAGFLILLPSVQHRRIVDSGEKTLPLGVLQMTAAPIILLAVLAAMVLVPADTAEWKSRALVNIVNDYGDLLGYHLGQGVPSQSFRLSLLGFQPLSDRLGGPISPGDMRMLTVTADRPVLLRGSVEDTYSGRGWYDGFRNGRFRYSGLMFLSTRNQVFGAELALPDRRDYEGRLTDTVKVTVKFEVRRLAGLFTAGRLERLDTGSRIEPYFNLQGELFTQNSAPPFSSYTFTARLLDRSTAVFDGLLTELEPTAQRGKDANWENIRLQYLSLPDALPRSVRDTAQMITADAQSPYAKAKAIEAWLAKNCTYTLTPVVPPPEEDFVAHFLRTREGYCVYYASAMAVLARCAGLPSRYVTGFGLERTAVPEEYAATERSTHAWAEVYLYGIGWVTFDPLGFDYGVTIPEPEPESADTTAQEGYERYIPAQPQHIPQSRENLQSHDAVPSASTLWGLVLLPVAFLLAVWLLLCRIRSAPERLYRYERVASSGQSTDGQLTAYYKDLLEQLNYFAISLYTGETLREFYPRVDRRFDDKSNRFAKVTACYMDWLYGGRLPDSGAVRDAAELHEQLERRLARRLGRAGYLLRRALPVWVKSHLRKKPD